MDAKGTHPMIGHEHVRAELAALARSDEPPHALLFLGPEETGRTLLALHYARLLACEEPTGERPCDACRPCRLIANGAHPDVVHVTPGDTLCRPRADESHAAHPDSREIRICQVRGIVDAISRYPLESPWRVIVLEPAEAISLPAAQALLKTLEEPPGHTVFILVTAAPELLPETVISRCRTVEVRPVPRATIEAALLSRGIDPTLAGEATARSSGRPGRALELARDEDGLEALRSLDRRFNEIVGRSPGRRLDYAERFAESWRSDRRGALAELDYWELFWERRLRAAADGHDEDGAADALDALRSIARVREDLADNVMVRPAVELMLLEFPRTAAPPAGVESQ